MEDPNAQLFSGPDDAEDGDLLQKELYEKNPARVKAMEELYYSKMCSDLDAMGLEGEDRCRMIFTLATSSVLDIISDSSDPMDSLNMYNALEGYICLALVNKKYKVDLLAEMQKALEGVDLSKYDEDEAVDAIAKLEDEWWEMPQPLLGHRTPSDALREIAKHIGLQD